MTRTLLLLAAVASLAAPALADPARPQPPAGPDGEVRIPFVDFGAIRSFEAWSDRVVYLQDRHRNWYKAELYGPCFGLDWANRIAIDSQGSSTFDRFSRLIVGSETCPIQSLTRSEKPQKPWKKKKAA